MTKFKTWYRGLPTTFEKAGYDWRSFITVFAVGTIASWAMIFTVYFVFSQPRTLAAFAVAIASAVMVTLILLPISVAQANRR